MANQFIDYTVSPVTAENDTGEQDLDSIRPIIDGERGSQATFRRPMENLRKRTETLRGTAEDQLYLSDADRALLLEGGGTVAWTYDVEQNHGSFTIGSDLVIRPMVGVTESTPATATILGLKFSTVTSAEGELRGSVVPRAYSGANKITIAVTGANGASLAVAVSGSPADNWSITINTHPDVGTTRQQLVDYLMANTTFLNAGLKVEVATGADPLVKIALVEPTSARLTGAVDGEEHVLSAAGLAAFFAQVDDLFVPINRLRKGDSLCIWYDSLVMAETYGGRRQSLAGYPEATSGKGTNVDNNLFIARRFPEKVPLAIPIASVDGSGRLIFANGVALSPGQSRTLVLTPADATTALDGTAAGGSASTFSRGDHKHGIGAGAITTTMLATGSVTEDILAQDAGNDANRAVGTDHIHNYAVTTIKLDSDAVDGRVHGDITAPITAGTYHGLAKSAAGSEAHGFMSASDRQLLEQGSVTAMLHENFEGSSMIPPLWESYPGMPGNKYWATAGLPVYDWQRNLAGAIRGTYSFRAQYENIDGSVSLARLRVNTATWSDLAFSLSMHGDFTEFTVWCDEVQIDIRASTGSVTRLLKNAIPPGSHSIWFAAKRNAGAYNAGDYVVIDDVKVLASPDYLTTIYPLNNMMGGLADSVYPLLSAPGTMNRVATYTQPANSALPSYTIQGNYLQFDTPNNVNPNDTWYFYNQISIFMARNYRIGFQAEVDVPNGNAGNFEFECGLETPDHLIYYRFFKTTGTNWRCQNDVALDVDTGVSSQSTTLRLEYIQYAAGNGLWEFYVGDTRYATYEIDESALSKWVRPYVKCKVTGVPTLTDSGLLRYTTYKLQLPHLPYWRTGAA